MRLLDQIVGQEVGGSDVHFLRLLDGERVVDAIHITGGDASNRYAKSRGLVATALLKWGVGYHLWEVESAPSPEDVDSGNDEGAFEHYANIED